MFRSCRSLAQIDEDMNKEPGFIIDVITCMSLLVMLTVNIVDVNVIILSDDYKLKDIEY
jgi:hypothetical protein